MISSCSRWMVATMSRMAPVRAPSSAASRAPGPPSSSSPSPSSDAGRPSPVPAAVGRLGARPGRCAGRWPPGGAEALVLDAHDPATLGGQVAPAGPGPWARGPVAR